MYPNSNNIVSSKIHIGNQQFLCVDANYVQGVITSISYNVSKQYGHSMVPISEMKISETGLQGNDIDLSGKYSITNKEVSERLLKYFYHSMSDTMKYQLTKIIKV